MDLVRDLRHSFESVHKNLSFLGLVILIACVTTLINDWFASSIIYIVTFLFGLGWLGTKFFVLNELISKRSVKIGQYPHLIWDYLKKLLPATLLLGLLALIPILLVLFTFAHWFLNAFNSPTGDSATRTQYLIQALQNRQVWTAFAKQYFWLSILISLLGVIWTVGRVIARVVIGVMVVNTISVKEAIKRTSYFLSQRFELILAYVLLQALIALILTLVQLLVSPLFHAARLDLLTMLSLTSLKAYLWLVLDAFILITIINRLERRRWWLHSVFAGIFSLAAKIRSK